jgi:integrase
LLTGEFVLISNTLSFLLNRLVFFLSERIDPLRRLLSDRIPTEIPVRSSICASFLIGALAPPADRIRAPYPEVKRDRALADQELNHLMHALRAEQSIFGPLIWVLLLTGQRRSEVAGMAWSELRDVDGDNAVWEIPKYGCASGFSAA